MENKKKILIVEDDPATRAALKDALQKETDLEVWESGDGKEALDAVRKFAPDMALVDVDIPGIDGITLVKMLADEGLTNKTKIMFLTNSSDLNRISAASATKGVIGYLIKSDWDVADIINQVKTNI